MRTLLLSSLLAFFAACSGGGGSAPASNNGVILEQIVLKPFVSTMAKGTSLTLTATGVYSDQSASDISDNVTWAVDDSTVLSLDTTQGVVISADNEGQTTIHATSGGIEAVLDVTVTSATLDQLTLSPTTVTLAMGMETELTASGTFSDLSTQDITDDVSWTSGDTAIASLDGHTVRGVSPGQTQITGSFDGLNGTIDVTVTDKTLDSIDVSPVDQTLNTGEHLQFQVVGHFSDNSTEDLTQTAIWSVDDTSLATISNVAGIRGLLYALAPGSLSVTATLGSVSDSTSLTTTGESITRVRITPTLVVVNEGSTLDLTFEGLFSDDSVVNLTEDVLWLSVNSSCATISNASGEEGRVEGIAAGQTFVTALFGQLGFVKPVFVIRSFDITGQEAGENRYQFIAYGDYGDDEQVVDMTAYVTWTSDNPSILSFSTVAGEEGLADVHTAGTVNVTAHYNEDITLTQSLNITGSK
jgi:trimeric autotransporter adhesin